MMRKGYTNVRLPHHRVTPFTTFGGVYVRCQYVRITCTLACDPPTFDRSCALRLRVAKTCFRLPMIRSDSFALACLRYVKYVWVVESDTPRRKGHANTLAQFVATNFANRMPLAVMLREVIPANDTHLFDGDLMLCAGTRTTRQREPLRNASGTAERATNPKRYKRSFTPMMRYAHVCVAVNLCDRIASRPSSQ